MPNFKKRNNSIKQALREIEDQKKLIHMLSQTARKKDAQDKIKLGGLVFKARLASLDTNLLYGALLEIADNITGENKDKYISYYRKKGKAELDAEAAAKLRKKKGL